MLQNQQQGQTSFSGITDRKLLAKKQELYQKLPSSSAFNTPKLSCLRASSSTDTNRWYCRVCKKSLCSKRSFTEHMNTHTRSRPFACQHCPYAAASQMTLRRHILRNHAPRKSWGYLCSYCKDSFMEPASYQHHVMTKHFGRSATFGCSSLNCDFTTLCSKHFRDHLIKHKQRERQMAEFLTTSGQPVLPTSDFQFENAETVLLNRYLVDDELGNGFGKTPIKFPGISRHSDRRPLTGFIASGVKHAWNSVVCVESTRKFALPRRSAWHKISQNDEEVFVDVDGIDDVTGRNEHRWQTSRNLVILNREEAHLSIEQEIEVDGTEEGLRKAAEPVVQKLPDGQVDFELD